MTTDPGDQTPQQPPDPTYPAGPPAPPPGYGPPPGWYAGAQPPRMPDHPDATKALVLGIIALVGGFMCALPLVLGPWAWVAGRKVVKEIDAQPERFEGRGQAFAGYVLGVIATVVLILGLLVLAGLAVLLIGFAVIHAPQPVPGQSL